MQDSIFLELQFWLLVLCSVIFPVVLYAGLMRLRRVSRIAVLCFGLFLVLLSGVDVVLLQRIAFLARHNTSLLDDRLFGPELSMALYLLALLSAGIGINMISHVLLDHLRQAEHSYDARRQRLPEVGHADTPAAGRDAA